MYATLVVFPLASAGAATLDKSAVQVTEWPVRVDTSIDAQASTNTSGKGSSESSGSVSGSSDSSVSHEGQFELTSDTSAKLNVAGNEPIHTDRYEMEDENGDASGSTISSGTPMTFDRVSTQEDLRSFISNSLHDDSDLQAMTFTNDDVEVAYASRGKLLAFIPVTLTTTAHVNANGEVTVSHPWYRFLVMEDSNADIEASIKAAIGSMIKANGEGPLSVRQAAAIAARVHEVFKGSYTAEGSANMTGSSDSYQSSTTTSTSTSER